MVLRSILICTQANEGNADREELTPNTAKRINVLESEGEGLGCRLRYLQRRGNRTKFSKVNAPPVVVTGTGGKEYIVDLSKEPQSRCPCGHRLRIDGACQHEVKSAVYLGIPTSQLCDGKGTYGHLRDQYAKGDKVPDEMFPRLGDISARYHDMTLRRLPPIKNRRRMKHHRRDPNNQQPRHPHPLERTTKRSKISTSGGWTTANKQRDGNDAKKDHI